MQGRPRRSVLYMPGSNERALEKAKTIPADALIFDLEDSVAPDAKALARDQVSAAVRNGGYGGREIVIRVNALETPWGTDDLLAACAAAPDAILVPKVVHSGDIISVAKILQGVHAPEKIRLWAMMETPMSILNARTIAATAVYAENRLCCLVMGTNDLIKESRARALHDRFAVVPWLAMTLVAARAYRLDILDGVYNDFQRRDRPARGVRARPHPRHGRQDPDPSEPSRALQRDLLADRRRRSIGRARSSRPSRSPRTGEWASSWSKGAWSSGSISAWPSARSPSPNRSARWRRLCV